MTEPTFDPYAVLQVARHAEPDVIQAAYRALARRVHPDHSDDPAAQVRMAELNRAWEILGDAVRRAEYDRGQRAGTGPAAPSASSPSWTSRTGQGGPGTGHGATGQPSGPTSSRPTWRVGPDGEGGAGPPPGNPSGTVLDFGRHIGWSMGEIARYDPGYLEWLERQPSGRRFREEIDRTLRRIGRRPDAAADSGKTRKGR